MSRRVRSKTALVAGVALVAAAAYGRLDRVGGAVRRHARRRPLVRDQDGRPAAGLRADRVDRRTEAMYDTLLTFRGGDVSQPGS